MFLPHLENNRLVMVKALLVNLMEVRFLIWHKLGLTLIKKKGSMSWKGFKVQKMLVNIAFILKCL